TRVGSETYPWLVKVPLVVKFRHLLAADCRLATTVLKASGTVYGSTAPSVPSDVACLKASGSMGIAVHAGRPTASSINMTLFVMLPLPRDDGKILKSCLHRCQQSPSQCRWAAATFRKATTETIIGKFRATLESGERQPGFRKIST